jgi:tripartite-type tricarboxylate transporter receptor subunit TctC
VTHAIVYRLAVALLAVALASSASAQSYPARRITIVVPFSPAPDAPEAFRRHGITPMYLDAAATSARLKSEVARWTEVARKAGLKPE